MPPASTTRSTRTQTAKIGTPGMGNARQPVANGASQASRKGKAKSTDQGSEPDREPIKAYLRIRPYLGSDDSVSTAEPYLQQLTDTTVQLTDSAYTSRTRATLAPQTTYAFSHVFPPNTSQEDFFQSTTVPLIKDLLEGQNGLMFAYGVSNSGKTYTIQGSTEKGSTGILPRALDVVFNSVDGLQSNSHYRPVHLTGVEASGTVDTPPALADPSTGNDWTDQQPLNVDSDNTKLKVDRNYEYSIWLSYAEIYNEKVYDLLADPAEASDASGMRTRLPQAKLRESSAANPYTIKRKALSLKNDPDGTGKYIAGLREIRARSVEEAKAILKTGQVNRRVFGTLANSASSRSHGIFTIKLLRVHKGARDDADSVLTARLCIVDLAGSERHKNTQNTGERLKEAGNINKSLMVLGQCMEALRTNQRKLAASLAGSGRSDTRELKLGVVPFRHSKLTELFQDFFVGSGRAVIVVNVNPYDTGFDENSHVMKFSSIAKEVNTSMLKPASRTMTVLPVTPTPAIARAPNKRQVTLTMQGSTKASPPHQAYLEVLEEDEDGGDDEDEPINPLVDALFDEIETLRFKLYEAELKSVIIEAETREEVMSEMEERMNAVIRRYETRINHVMEQAELKANAKLDIIGLTGRTPRRPVYRKHDPRSPEDEITLSHESFTASAETSLSLDISPSLSAHKTKPRRSLIPPSSPMKVVLVSDGEEVDMLRLEDEDDASETTEASSESDDPLRLDGEEEEADEDEEDDPIRLDGAEADEDEEDEYNDTPSDEESVAAATSSLKQPSKRMPGLPPVWDSSTTSVTRSAGRAPRAKNITTLEKDMEQLGLQSNMAPRRSARSRNTPANSASEPRRRSERTATRKK